MSSSSLRRLVPTITLAVATLTLARAQSGVITEASIRGHMEFLASDAMNGRGSGTTDEWRAATYIGSQLRRWNIEPLGDSGGYVQAIENGRYEVTAPPTLIIGNKTFTHGKEILVQSAGGATVTAPLAKHKPEMAPPAGAAVLVPEGATANAASLAGAAIVLTVETPELRAQWDPSLTRLSGGRRGGAGQPATRIVLDKASYEFVTSLPELSSITFQAAMKPGHTWNAIGQLTGSDPARKDEVILLTAHLDHLGARGTAADNIYNGADDDASGTTAVLELAEALSKGPRPKRTVMFAWFGSEESGGAGARNFLDHPPVPLDRITANLEFEMIGRPDPKVEPHTLWLTGYERTNLGPELAKQGARIVADPHPEQNFFSRSDNIQLARRGVVAQTVSSFGLHKEYHQPSDDLAHIDFAHMTDSIQSMLAPVLYLLNSTFKPEWLPGKKPGL